MIEPVHADPRPPHRSPPPSNAVRNGLVVALLLAAIGAGVWFGVIKNRDEPLVTPPTRVEPPPPPPIVEEKTAPQYPIETAVGTPDPPQEPLPTLDQSDAAVLALLGTLFGESAIELYANPEFVIQRIVTTVDNLPKRRIAPAANPVRPVGGALVTEGTGDATVLGAANAARYAPYVALVEQVDIDALAAGYRRMYPLFQQAYRELGDPDAHFNDRLVEVIDHLLAAPEAPGPLQLRKNRAYLEFVDPALEARTAGEKLMIRLGPEQAAQVKRRLAALRVALTSPPPATEPAAVPAVEPAAEPAPQSPATTEPVE